MSCRRCRAHFYCLLCFQTEPIYDVRYALVEGERGTGESLFAGQPDDAIFGHFHDMRANRVASGRRTGGGHAIGGEEDTVWGFGAVVILEHERRQVQAIRNEAGNQFIAGEQPLDDVVVAVQVEWHGVADVRGERGTGCNGRVDGLFGGVGVAEGDTDAVVGGGFYDRQTALHFGGEGDQFQMASSRISEPTIIG